MPQKLILDVDTGTDDALALMVAALHPDLELVAATTVNGNVPVRNCTENTLRVFDYIGVDIPVYEGLATPLFRPDFPWKEDRTDKHDESIHGAYLDIPAAASKVQEQRAVDFLIDYYMSGEGDDTILCPVGPLSNIAMVIRLEPRVAEHIPEIIIMGGGHETGNVTPVAEFNIWADPEGARIVFNAGIPLTVVPLDATHKALINEDDLNTFKGMGTPAGQAAAIFSNHLMDFHKTSAMVPFGNVPMHDSLVVCAVADRSVIKTEHLHVDVETSGELTVGQTVVDLYKRHGVPNCHFAFDVDPDLYHSIIMETLARKAN